MVEWLKNSKLEWKDFPEDQPTERGYYYTYYFNHDENEHFLKCIYWDTKSWLPWRPGGGPKLTVIKYAPKTWAPYYGISKLFQYEDEKNG